MQAHLSMSGTLWPYASYIGDYETACGDLSYSGEQSCTWTRQNEPGSVPEQTSGDTSSHTQYVLMPVACTNMLRSYHINP